MSAVSGTRALAVAQRWFDGPTVARVFEPLVADWQREWREAAPSERPSARLRGAATFACAFALSTPRIVTTPVPSAVMRRVVVKIGMFVAVGAVLSSIPLFNSRRPELTAALIVVSLPSILLIVLPFAMFPAADAIRRHEALPDHVEGAAAVKVGSTTVLILLLFGGWLSPAIRREWREMTDAGATTPGLSEMSITRLAAEAAYWSSKRVQA